MFNATLDKWRAVRQVGAVICAMAAITAVSAYFYINYVLPLIFGN